MQSVTTLRDICAFYVEVCIDDARKICSFYFLYKLGLTNHLHRQASFLKTHQPLKLMALGLEAIKLIL